MHISAKSDYAVRALIELASSGTGLMKSEVLAQSQHIPARFLESILAELRRSGVVISQRGAVGGYRLGRPAQDITIADVIRAVDGPLAEVRGVRPEDSHYDGIAEPLQLVWIAARASLRSVLDQVTLEHVVTGRLPASVTKLAGRPEAWEPR